MKESIELFIMRVAFFITALAIVWCFIGCGGGNESLDSTNHQSYCYPPNTPQCAGYPSNPPNPPQCHIVGNEYVCS